MFNNLSIRYKIIGVFVILFVAGFFINFLVTRNKLRSEALDAVVTEAEQLTLALEEVRDGMGEMFTGGFYDLEELMEEAQQARNKKNAKLYLAVPVVHSLMVGAHLAREGSYSFKAPSLNPRNPENTPTPLESRLLRKLQNENLPTVWEIDKASNSLHYLRKVTLSADCMGCHGTIEDSLTGTLMDPLGYQMEGMQIGDMRGAFELIMPLNHVDSAVTSATLTNAGVTTMIAALGIALLTLLTNAVLTQPIAKLVDATRCFAGGDLTQRIEIDTQDEIGELAESFNAMAADIHRAGEGLQAEKAQSETQRHYLAESVEKMVEGMQQFAHGDLHVSLSTEAEDEIAQLYSGFNTMVERHREIHAELQNAAQKLSGATQRIDGIVKNQASGVSQQAAAVQEVVASVEESSKTSVRIAENTNQVAEFAQQSLECAQQGQARSNQAIEAMGSLLRASDENVRQVSALNEKSRAIEEVIEFINNIARKTDLLSLNASIEAVNAGEAGKGFGVVANETRRLAVEVMESTHQIKTLTQEIQEAIGRSAMAMDESAQQVSESGRLVEQTAGSLGEILTLVSQTAEAAEIIKNGTSEQQIVSEQIAKAMVEINEVCRQVESDAKESVSASGELTDTQKGLERFLT